MQVRLHLKESYRNVLNDFNTPNTWTFGLVGKDISYSLSPFLHQEVQNFAEITEEYQIFDIASEKALFDFLDVFCSFSSSGRGYVTLNFLLTG